MKDVLEAYRDEAEAPINGLLRFSANRQGNVDRVLESKKAGVMSSAAQTQALNESELFLYGAKHIIEFLSQSIQDKRSFYNSKVSRNVLRGSISFALLTILMLSAMWAAYFVTIRTQRKNAQLTERLEFEATHDTLTGLPNRRYMHAHLAHAIGLADRHRHRLALMVMDLDGFKLINDTLGHSAGDFVLQEVAGRFKKISREVDFIVRLGGDEFALVAEKVGNSESLRNLGTRMIGGLAEPVELPDNTKAKVGCSIGMAIYPDQAKSMDELFSAADRAMYAAKADGKNCFRLSE